MHKLLLPAVAALLLVSCAGTKSFTIRTSPAKETKGAMVVVNGKKVGASPVTLDIKQDKSLAIVVTKPGFEAATATVKNEPDFWLSLLWTKNDPKAQVIKQNSITIPMKSIPTSQGYNPGSLPDFSMPKPGTDDVPSLRAMPKL